MYIVIFHDNDEDITSGVFGPFTTREEASEHLDKMKRFEGDEGYLWVSVVEIEAPEYMEEYWREAHGLED